ncbi:MAG: DUF6206 family protein [Microthrixaceae bacterium]
MSSDPIVSGDEPPVLGPERLAELERLVGCALRSGDTGPLRVLGYGEISLVLGWPTTRPTLACKRLPVFRNEQGAGAYGALIAEYVAELVRRGVRVVPTGWETTTSTDGRFAGYVVQPAVAEDTLAPQIVAADAGGSPELIAAIMDATVGAVDAQVGLDAQLSNWALVDGELRYFDVTTPLLAGADGRTRLDLGLLTQPLPAAIRPVVRRLVAPGLVGAYHQPRHAVVDLIGNLLKERLEHAVAPALSAANRRVSPAITREEVDRWYRSDARTWSALLRLRRADRWWQRRVRRRTYPYLLPGPIRR